MASVQPDVDSLREKIIGCAIAVHRTLGPGLLESVYRECLMIELESEGIYAERDYRVSLRYKGRRVANELKIDVLTERCVVVELKAVESIHPVHLAQVITYLKLAGCPAGLLINFNCTSLRAGLRKLVHPNLYKKKAE